MSLDAAQVKLTLKDYFDNEGISSVNEYKVFDHGEDDVDERDFRIDFVTRPFATKGDRDRDNWCRDRARFNDSSEKLDYIVRSLKPYSLFPGTKDKVGECWEFKCNTNPMVGIAIEIENTLSKYFLGSLVAAAMAGRWGIVIVESCAKADKWIEAVGRMVNKGYEGRSPIPSNVLVFDWPSLRGQISEFHQLDTVIVDPISLTSDISQPDRLSSPHPPGG